MFEYFGCLEGQYTDMTGGRPGEWKFGPKKSGWVTILEMQHLKPCHSDRIDLGKNLTLAQFPFP